MPIALKRPIRKVSFSDLSAMDQHESHHKSAPMYSPLPRKSSSFSQSYSLKDAFCNRIPLSPSCSNHSQGSDTDESKVRGGHLFDSDRISSTDSLNNLEQSLSGLTSPTATTLNSPRDTLSSSTQSHTTTLGLIPSHSAPGALMSTAANVLLSSSGQQDEQDQLRGSQDKLGASWDHTKLFEQQQKLQTHCTDASAFQCQLAASYDDERSSRGWKTHGGNLFMQGGCRCRRLAPWHACYIVVLLLQCMLPAISYYTQEKRIVFGLYFVKHFPKLSLFLNP